MWVIHNLDCVANGIDCHQIILFLDRISAKFELKEDQALIDLFEYANGTSSDADLQNIFL